MSDRSPLDPACVSVDPAGRDALLVGEPPAEATQQSLAYLLRELRAQQAELEQSRDRYRDLYEFAPVGYLTLTRSGRVAEANITAATLLGVERERLFEQNFERFVAPADRSRWLQKFAAVMARGGLQAFEMALCGADGEGCQVQVACLRVEPDAAEAAAGRLLRVTLIDISEKKRLGDELEHHRAHLEALVQRRTAELVVQRDAADSAKRLTGSFLSRLDLAIRTPMNSILGLSHLLRRSGVSAQQREILDQIDLTGRQLSSLIDGVLDLARIDTAQSALDPVDFRPADLRRSIDAQIGAAICAKGLTWATDFTGLPEVLHGDVARLDRALLNYLNNAYRYTERGGIVLEARLVEDGDADCLVRFTVRDSGVGLSAERQQSIFAARDAGKTIEGAGLGLALTRHSARSMGGEVGVESVAGQGSSFWLTVRLGKVAAAPEPSAGEADEANEANEEGLRRRHAGARVLLAEDEPTTQQVMRLLLQGSGLAVDLAGDGAQAVELARRNAYALILMDVHMPQLDGLEATRAIRALPGRQATAIVAMTADVDAEDRRACLAAGMNDFLAKPVAPERLFAALSRWLDLARATGDRA